jgi:hypothetical protein
VGAGASDDGAEMSDSASRADCADVANSVGTIGCIGAEEPARLLQLGSDCINEAHSSA